MNIEEIKTPPGLSSRAQLLAHASRSAIHMSTPRDVKTMSYVSRNRSGAAATSDSTNRAGTPIRPARSRAIRNEAAEKSTPVTRAPRRAQDSVSRPMWHCRWTNSAPLTSPTSATSISPRESRPATKDSTA
jgi:hypothetical protein